MAEHHHFGDVLVLLAALLIFVPLFQWLRIGSVLAYLAAGVVIGPSLLGLISDVESTRPFAELGVVFLLFAVGLEISPQRLRLMGWRTLLLAVAQLVVTVPAIAGLAWAAGVEARTALIVGGALALSSTAVVLQVLSERGRMTGHLGRSAVAILLVQDLAVVPMILFISSPVDPTAALGRPLIEAAVKFIVVVAAMLLAERTVLRPLLRLAAQANAPEVFTGTALMLVLGTGWVTQQAGLSMALGAFLAGIMVADTEFRHQVAGDIQPFRGLLLGLFFITVGMSLDLGQLADRPVTVASVVIVLIVVKASVLAGLGLAFRLPASRALALGGLLAQGSEFAFVLVALAMSRGLVTADLGQVLTLAVGVSMAMTPLGYTLLQSFDLIRSRSEQNELGNLDLQGDVISGHVVVAGFGQVGMAVSRYLASERVPVLILDLSPRRVSASRARGLRVFYGNATRADVLRAAHLDRASAFVVAMPEPESAEQACAVARQSFPQLRVFARARDEEWVGRLRAAGADAVVLDGLTTALELAERVMLFYQPADGADA